MLFEYAFLLFLGTLASVAVVSNVLPYPRLFIGGDRHLVRVGETVTLKGSYYRGLTPVEGVLELRYEFEEKHYTLTDVETDEKGVWTVTLTEMPEIPEVKPPERPVTLIFYTATKPPEEYAESNRFPVTWLRIPRPM